MSTPTPITQSDRKSYQYFLSGLILALLIWGLQLIGVTVNVWLGGLVLAIAFGLMVYAFWIWEGASLRWHKALRIGTIVAATIIYSWLIGGQIVQEWRKEHPVIVRITKPQEKGREEQAPPISGTPPNTVSSQPRQHHAKPSPATKKPNS